MQSKPLSLFLVVSLLAVMGFGQQEPLFSQYRLNAFVINPAVAGSQPHQELRFGVRTQWQSMPGAPQTYTLSYHGRTDDRSGIGGMIFSDIVGPSSRNGIQLAYAYRIHFGQPGNVGQNTLALGFAGKVIQYRFQGERVQFLNPADPAAAEAAQGITVADASLGALWKNDRWYAGFSIPNVIQSDFGAYIPSGGQRSLISQLSRHYFLTAGVRFDYDKSSLEPSVLIKKTDGTPYQIEGTLKWYVRDDRLIFGVGYRTEWLLTGFFAIQGDNWLLAYSADVMLPQRSPVISTFGPSHELTLGFNIGKHWKTMFRGEDF